MKKVQKKLVKDFPYLKLIKKDLEKKKIVSAIGKEKKFASVKTKME